MKENLYKLSGYLKDQNPGFEGSVIDDFTSGLTDNVENQFYVRLVTNGLKDYTFQNIDYSGCGGLEVDTEVEIIFGLEKCINTDKALTLLLNQLLSYGKFVINSASTNASQIYNYLYKAELPNELNLIYVKGKMKYSMMPLVCALEICEENCCK
jgi:hypothetical protein